jgi:hypothetical protein
MLEILLVPFLYSNNGIISCRKGGNIIWRARRPHSSLFVDADGKDIEIIVVVDFVEGVRRRIAAEYRRLYDADIATIGIRTRQRPLLTLKFPEFVPGLGDYLGALFRELHIVLVVHHIARDELEIVVELLYNNEPDASGIESIHFFLRIQIDILAKLDEDLEELLAALRVVPKGVFDIGCQ